MFSTVSIPSSIKSYNPIRCQKICAKNYSMSQRWDLPYLVLCRQWHKLGQNNVKNVSALGFSIPITVSTITQIGKNSVNNVSALGFFISIIVSTMTLIGTKLCQQCVSIGILHIHYCVNNDTNWGKIVSTMCQHWDSPYPLLCQQ